jgi:hypothetical protein
VRFGSNYKISDKIPNQTMSSRVSRRDAIRALAAAGAVIAAAPYLANGSGAVESSQVGTTAARSIEHHEGPLVIVMTEEGTLGFKGEQEFRVDDSNLASQLSSTFSGKRVE